MPEAATLSCLEISEEWQELLRLIPGYDPISTAGDCRFDPEIAERALSFIPDCLRHVKGAKGGQSIELEPWENSIIANLFGWMRPDGMRRYREAFIYVPRKNGKTTLAAIVVLLLFFLDREPGSEIYCAAADREQASLVFAQAKGMVLQEPELARRCQVYQKAIVRSEVSASFKTISADANTKHGYNAHGVVIDELHAQKNRELVDVLMTSTGARSQPLVVHITTADFRRPSICNEKYATACKVRDQKIDKPSFLPVIYETKFDEDWRDERVWRKANPNLGVSFQIDYLRDKCQDAIEIPAFENTFRRLHLNQQTEQDERAIQMEQWDKCAGPPILDAALEGRPCFGGLDMASTTDVTAFVLLFPPEDTDDKSEPWIILPKFWIPGVNAILRDRRDSVPYTAWIRDGWITAHDGNRTDYDAIRVDINEMRERFNIQDVGVDRWNATQLIMQLTGDGLGITPFGQGFKDMTAPTKEFLAKIGAGQIRHGGNPVLSWMAGNLAVESDAAGNLKPSKKKSTERIDGMVALIMALGRAMVQEILGPSWYEDHDLEIG